MITGQATPFLVGRARNPCLTFFRKIVESHDDGREVAVHHWSFFLRKHGQEVSQIAVVTKPNAFQGSLRQ